MGLGKSNRPIFSTFLSMHIFEHQCAKYRPISFPGPISVNHLVSLLFTPPLSFNPICNQLSRRECFYLLVHCNSVLYTLFPCF